MSLRLVNRRRARTCSRQLRETPLAALIDEGYSGAGQGDGEEQKNAVHKGVIADRKGATCEQQCVAVNGIKDAHDQRNDATEQAKHVADAHNEFRHTSLLTIRAS